MFTDVRQEGRVVESHEQSSRGEEEAIQVHRLLKGSLLHFI